VCIHFESLLCTSDELETLDNWIALFKSKYPVVGSVVSADGQVLSAEGGGEPEAPEGEEQANSPAVEEEDVGDSENPEDDELSLLPAE
jgi:hypothetical protein